MSLSRPTMAAVRFGYGLRPEQDAPRDADALLSQLDGGASDTAFPSGGSEASRDEMLGFLAELADIPRDDVNFDRKRSDVRKKVEAVFRRNSVLRIQQAVMSPSGFEERLASFWMNHFAVSAQKSIPLRMLTPLYETEAVRPNMAGSFRTLLHAAILHPAMLSYLDQTQSIGPESQLAKRRGGGLNENLGRELIELHTLGAGGPYGQSDVRAAAMVLTGLSVQRRTMTAAFLPARSEQGQFVVLDTAYEDRPEARTRALLDDLAAHPSTAQHVCRKLVSHFIADEPPREIVDGMVSAWVKSDGRLIDVYAAMLEAPRAWQEEGVKIKTPFEFIVSGLRALDADPAFFRGDGKADRGEGNDRRLRADTADDKPEKRRRTAESLTIASMRSMGQPLWRPPSPAGFADSAATWLSPGQLSLRIAWARRAASALPSETAPRDFLRDTLADAARDNTIRVVSQAPDRRTGIALVLASAEFNRR